MGDKLSKEESSDSSGKKEEGTHVFVYPSKHQRGDDGMSKPSISDEKNVIESHHHGEHPNSIEIVPFFIRDGLFECNYCYFNSENQEEFNQHFESDHGDLKKGREFRQCPICPMKYSYESSLKNHLKEVHGRCSSDRRNKDLGKTEERFFSCDHCDQKFNMVNKSGLERHLLRNHLSSLAASALRAGKVLGNSTLSSLRIVEENGKFKCKTCKNIFKTRVSALKHSRYICHRHWTVEDFEKESGSIFLECFHCDAKFKTNEKLKLISHMHQQHITKTKPNNKCHICSKSFGYASQLKEHIEGVHEKKIKCEKCKKHFTQKVNMIAHIRNNSCKLWSKTEQKSCLRDAIRKKLSKEDLTCKICSKEFKRNTDLSRHIEAVHERKVKAKCEICGQTFHFVGDFKNHLKYNRCKVEMLK